MQPQPQPRASHWTALLIAAVMTALVVPATAQIPAELPDPDKKPPTTRKPVKVFILMGQSNMVGFGRIAQADKLGTLEYLCKKKGMYPHLLDDRGEWTVRNDVWCVKTTVGQTQGWLKPGFGARNQFIGPELQFGHVMGYMHDEPVLIIKASQGNRSLGWDILPPRTKQFKHGGRVYAGYKDTPSSWVEGQPKKKVNWYAGKQYDDFVRDIHEVLDDLPKFFPSYNKKHGYKIAGFAWWQGHKDQNAAHASRYEFNLVNLIKSLRKEFEAPKAPFVIATIAFGGQKLKGHGLTVLNAQLAVSGEKGKYEEFAGNVKTVDARRFWREKSISPNGRQGHHYNQNAETFVEVGNALGRAMARLLNKKNKPSKR